jgi:hypothetical protein
MKEGVNSRQPIILLTTGTVLVGRHAKNELQKKTGEKGKGIQIPYHLYTHTHTHTHRERETLLVLLLQSTSNFQFTGGDGEELLNRCLLLLSCPSCC